SLVSPSRRPPSTSAWRTHIRSVSVEIPSSTAISLSGRPDLRTSSTASRLNSGGYGFPKFDPLTIAEHPSSSAGQRHPSAQLSTKTGALHGCVALGQAHHLVENTSNCVLPQAASLLHSQQKTRRRQPVFSGALAGEVR